MTFAHRPEAVLLFPWMIFSRQREKQIQRTYGRKQIICVLDTIGKIFVAEIRGNWGKVRGEFGEGGVGFTDQERNSVYISNTIEDLGAF